MPPTMPPACNQARCSRVKRQQTALIQGIERRLHAPAPRRGSLAASAGVHLDEHTASIPNREGRPCVCSPGADVAAGARVCAPCARRPI